MSDLTAVFLLQVPGKTPLQQLMADALILAKRSGHDVFNALDLMQNMDVFKASCALCRIVVLTLHVT